MTDESCLVSCTGLYADIVDDSLKQATQAFEQNVMKGRVLLNFSSLIQTPFGLLDIFTHMLGFQLLTHELRDGHGIQWSYGREESKARERLYLALQQMFPTFPDKKVDEIQTLTKSYHKYKSHIVKHQFFMPDNDNLSKYFLT